MLDWFKESMFLIPNWAWIAIILGIACLLMAIIIVACVKKGDKSKENSAEPVPMPAEEVKAEEVKEEKVTEEVAAEPEPVAEPVAEPEPVLVEEEPVKKPAAKKTTTAKKTTATKSTETKSASTKTTAAKTTAKKEEPKAAAKTTAAKSTTAKAKNEETKTAATAEKKEQPKTAAKPAAKTATAKAGAGNEDDVKIYHISKRYDKKWEVRLDGGEKALKLFFTQKEAIDYVRKVSGKKKILVHKEDGGVREV
ncbi:MAG: DUF2188 domain-containing protein [Clostridia bacterium]|nr:DUF2188 domain-containing protein [Clostridia bacterium]